MDVLVEENAMRQAVVIVHGMGEQRPNDFLNGFIDAAVPEPTGAGVRYRSKPDRLSELFELRRLAAPGTRRRPSTHFYEYYWAHHMQGGKLKQVLPLLRALFLRPVWHVPGSLRFVWLLGWASTVTVLALVAIAWSTGVVDDIGGLAELALALGIAGLAGGAVRFAMKTLVAGFAVSYFGDVARYVDRDPQNVDVRQKIRSDGVTLLRRIHESGLYDRVVVVGHSLGSIIAYDVLTRAYSEMNRGHASPSSPVNEALECLEKAGLQLTGADDPHDPTAYRSLQRRAWIEQRVNGNRWLVTDFVSVGSPLTHAPILLAHDADELARRAECRELPTAPPQYDEHRFSYERNYSLPCGDRRTTRALHHGAVFGVTRWTNIWTPARFGVLGDWFGGPLSPTFGRGILDLPVTTGPRTRFLPIFPHTQYFRGADSAANNRSGGSIHSLREGMDLDGEWLSDVPVASAEDDDW